jgi:hypothetical protein
MRRLLFITFILLSVAACNRARVPRDIIRQENLAPILVDIHMVYAIQTSMEFRNMTREFDSVDTHGYIFDKHGIDKVQFDSSIAWYSRHPALFTEVYDDVVMRLTQLNDSINPDRE